MSFKKVTAVDFTSSWALMASSVTGKWLHLQGLIQAQPGVLLGSGPQLPYIPGRILVLIQGFLFLRHLRDVVPPFLCNHLFHSLQQVLNLRVFPKYAVVDYKIPPLTLFQHPLELLSLPADVPLNWNCFQHLRPAEDYNGVLPHMLPKKTDMLLNASTVHIREHAHRDNE